MLGGSVRRTAFTRLFNWLLCNYPDHTIALLAGLILGTFIKTWP